VTLKSTAGKAAGLYPGPGSPIVFGMIAKAEKRRMTPVRTMFATLACALCLALTGAPSFAAPSPDGLGDGAAPVAQTGGMTLAEAPRRAPRPALRAAPPRPVAASPRTSAAAALRAPRPAPRPSTIAAKARSGDGGRPTASLRSAATSGARPRATASRAVQAAATVPGAAAAGAPSLIGVFGGPDTRRALIRAPDGALRRVRQGDRFAGWTVSAIGPDSVQLRDGARAQTLRIPGS